MRIRKTWQPASPLARGTMAKCVPAMGFYAWESAQKAKRYPDFRGNSQISKSTKNESLNLMIYFIEGFPEYSVKYTYIAVVKMDDRMVG